MKNLPYPLPVLPGEWFMYFTGLYEVVRQDPPQKKGVMKGIVEVRVLSNGVPVGKGDVVLLYQLRLPDDLKVLPKPQRARLRVHLEQLCKHLEVKGAGRSQEAMAARRLRTQYLTVIRTLPRTVRVPIKETPVPKKIPSKRIRIAKPSETSDLVVSKPGKKAAAEGRCIRLKKTPRWQPKLRHIEVWAVEAAKASATVFVEWFGLEELSKDDLAYLASRIQKAKKDGEKRHEEE